MYGVFLVYGVYRGYKLVDYLLFELHIRRMRKQAHPQVRILVFLCEKKCENLLEQYGLSFYGIIDTKNSM